MQSYVRTPEKYGEITTVMLILKKSFDFIFLDDHVDKPIKVKIYDFQLYFYQTFVCDLIFFLFTSVRCDDLKKNFKLFIYHYHSAFINTMKLANCSRDDYTYEKLV